MVRQNQYTGGYEWVAGDGGNDGRKLLKEFFRAILIMSALCLALSMLSCTTTRRYREMESYATAVHAYYSDRTSFYERQVDSLRSVIVSRDSLSVRHERADSVWNNVYASDSLIVRDSVYIFQRDGMVTEQHFHTELRWLFRDRIIRDKSTNYDAVERASYLSEQLLAVSVTSQEQHDSITALQDSLQAMQNRVESVRTTVRYSWFPMVIVGIFCVSLVILRRRYIL